MQKIIFVIIMAIIFNNNQVFAANEDKAREDFYRNVATITNIPWYILAAIDQFEKNIITSRKELDKDKMKKRLTYFSFPLRNWVGELNPNITDQSLVSIEFFAGLGDDGDGDNKADPYNDSDVFYTLTKQLKKYGNSEEEIWERVWDYYGNDRTVTIIKQTAELFKHFQTISLEEKKFPLPKYAKYTYKSTWGDARGWGGRRIHEGTDIFAGYGTPVQSVSFGIIETMGWNLYGGWRVGIRDINNIYYYYAHLAGFKKGLKAGDIVKPGDIIGYVGSSGYGKPGTSGKFPPHLHFGMYKYNGKTEWAFDPYPYLKRWEKDLKSKKESAN